MARDYSGITFPRTLAHWKLSTAIEQVRPFWDKIPQRVARKINQANTNRTDLVLDKDDFDAMSNDVWEQFKPHLHHFS